MSDPAAYHEFGMFGASSVFLSHYPMYHSIHAYQVILEAVLKPAEMALFTADRAKTKERLYTIEPERFVLTELAPGPSRRTAFRARLYRGHFERGGTAIGGPLSFSQTFIVGVTQSAVLKLKF